MLLSRGQPEWASLGCVEYKLLALEHRVPDSWFGIGENFKDASFLFGIGGKSTPFHLTTTLPPHPYPSLAN